MHKKVCFVSYLLGYAISPCHFSVFILRVSGLCLLLTCSPWDPISICQSMDEEVFSHISKLWVGSKISAYFSTTVLIHIYIYTHIYIYIHVFTVTHYNQVNWKCQRPWTKSTPWGGFLNVCFLIPSMPLFSANKSQDPVWESTFPDISRHSSCFNLYFNIIGFSSNSLKWKLVIWTGRHSGKASRQLVRVFSHGFCRTHLCQMISNPTFTNVNHLATLEKCSPTGFLWHYSKSSTNWVHFQIEGGPFLNKST